MAPRIFPLVEEREADLVNFNGTQQPLKRKGLFLNPTSSTSSIGRPKVAAGWAASSAAGDEINYPNFRWWADPQPQWDQWVDKLTPKYTHIWKKAGIFDAIMASKLKLRRDCSSLLGVSSFWSKQSNTFIFPWAEATVTLEDVMILGGFSVLGEPVRVKEPIGGVTGYMVNKMMTEFNSFKQKRPKGEQFKWMNRYFGRCNGDETEHIAFLSLWLSRFVLIAADGRAIRECVFQVAVRLAIGTKIALAPAVLASIYQELGVVKENLCKKSYSLIFLCAPMNIVQLWLWKRFLPLRTNLTSLITPDTPRASRQSLAGKTVDLSSVMKVFESSDDFQWRPYVDELKNEGLWFFSCDTQDEDLQSYVKCLRACELVGLDCIKLYLPHRVAMQFGLDQDIPKFVPRVKDSWEVAWKTYDISLNNVKFYVSPGFYNADVTFEYLNWWKMTKKQNKKRKEAQDLSGSQMKKVKGFKETELSTAPAHRPDDINDASDYSETMKWNLNATREVELVCENQQNDSVNKEGTTGAIEKTYEGEFHNEQAEEESKEEKEKQLKEESQTEVLNANEEGTMKSSLNTEAVEFDHHLVVSEKPKEKCHREESSHELKRKKEVTEETEERVPTKKKDLERELECKTEETDKIKEKDQAREKEIEHESILERNPTSTKELELQSRGKAVEAMKKSLKCESMRGKKEAEMIEESRERNPESKDRTKEMMKEMEPESIPETNEIKVIDERDPASSKELQLESEGKTKETSKEIEERDSAKKKELERDMKIKQLKDEIASIQEQIQYWESIAEAQSKLKKVFCPP